jgi:hypothetical protein
MEMDMDMMAKMGGMFDPKMMEMMMQGEMEDPRGANPMQAQEPQHPHMMGTKGPQMPPRDPRQMGP